ncbi:uncharacterized protein Tco025E_07734 [Trypanosoma conorhini]|uniref:Uncharacterized protein n=1 Tax=Trypanosoma conorhini TaxID=83891 RepID=A0A3R7NFE3_9TRYP|nr:uncharacterized protein Tco025E_07734 [Trypanosoma conorhini]RNF05735.1 hypothetical protein Tco025E_07734 [Trypanosoma conorhini]
MARSDNAAAWDILCALALDDAPADAQPARGSQRRRPSPPRAAGSRGNGSGGASPRRGTDAAGLLLEAEALLLRPRQRHPPAAAEAQGSQWQPQAAPPATVAAVRGTGPPSCAASQESRSGRAVADGHAEDAGRVGGRAREAAPRAVFTAPVAATTTVYRDTAAGHEAAVAPAALHPPPRSVTHDAERDALLALKEARRLRRTQPTPQAGHRDATAAPHAVRCSLQQRLDLLRSAHRDTAAALAGASRLLLQERKWINVRCTILYERLQLLAQHRTTVVRQLRSAHGDAVTALLTDHRRDA